MYFSFILKQDFFAIVNHAWICSYNQPVLSNDGSFLLKETTGVFNGAVLELVTDQLCSLNWYITTELCLESVFQGPMEVLLNNFWANTKTTCKKGYNDTIKHLQ